MINGIDLRKIICDVIEGCGYRAQTLHKLIEITFYESSGMSRLVSEDDHHGFLQLSYESFEYILYNCIKCDQTACRTIKETSMVDVLNSTTFDLFNALKYNIAFNVGVAFWYYMHQGAMLVWNVDDCVIAYMENWKSDEDESSFEDVMDRFIVLDKSIKHNGGVL